MGIEILRNHIFPLFLFFYFIGYIYLPQKWTSLNNQSGFRQFHGFRNLHTDVLPAIFKSSSIEVTTKELIYLSIPLQLRSWSGEQMDHFWDEQFLRIPYPSLNQRVFQKANQTTKLEIVLIEPRKGEVKNLFPALKNIATVYGGTDAALTLIVSRDSSKVMKKLMINYGWKNIRVIHIGGHFPRIPHYNDMLTSKWFWEYFKSRHVLVTHIDSFIYRPIDEYLFEYDNIGAPWPHYPHMVGNGGYVLRKVSTMQLTLGVRKPEEVGYILQSGYAQQKSEAEDVFWAANVKNQPPSDIALAFGVEMYSKCDLIPTGAHQISRFAGTFECSGDYWRFWDQYLSSKTL